MAKKYNIDWFLQRWEKLIDNPKTQNSVKAAAMRDMAKYCLGDSDVAGGAFNSRDFVGMLAARCEALRLVPDLSDRVVSVVPDTGIDDTVQQPVDNVDATPDDADDPGGDQDNDDTVPRQRRGRRARSKVTRAKKAPPLGPPAP